VPDVQLVQLASAVAPIVGLYVPAGQLLHWAALVAPVDGP
jgi:hypothetical protein